MEVKHDRGSTLTREGIAPLAIDPLLQPEHLQTPFLFTTRVGFPTTRALNFFYKGVVLHLSSESSKNRFAQKRKIGFVAPAPPPLKRYIYVTCELQ